MQFGSDENRWIKSESWSQISAAGSRYCRSESSALTHDYFIFYHLNGEFDLSSSLKTNKYEQIRSFNSTRTVCIRTRQIGDYWRTWSITLSEQEVQPLHQTLVKTWNHVNQNWADGRLLGIYWSAHWSQTLLWPVCWSPAEAPSGSLVVCSLAWYQPNEQTELGVLGVGGEGGEGLAPSANQMLLSLTAAARLVSSLTPDAILADH